LIGLCSLEDRIFHPLQTVNFVDEKLVRNAERSVAGSLYTLRKLSQVKRKRLKNFLFSGTAPNLKDALMARIILLPSPDVEASSPAGETPEAPDCPVATGFL